MSIFLVTVYVNLTPAFIASTYSSSRVILLQFTNSNFLLIDVNIANPQNQ